MCRADVLLLSLIFGACHESAVCASARAESGEKRVHPKYSVRSHVPHIYAVVTCVEYARTLDFMLNRSMT